jgi:hypothetical protein
VLQKALRADKFYGGPIDGIFGAGTADACHKAKYRLGYPIKAVNHCGGQQLLNFLTGAWKLPPDFISRRHARGFGVTEAERQRVSLVSYARWCCQNSANIHYAQVRPMDHLHRPKLLPWTTDCSEFVTSLYSWVGAPDPNGFGYNGYGYTGSMLYSGQTIAMYQCKPGDVVIWGYFPGHHTAMIVDMSNSSDPIIASHGSERGPLWMRYSFEWAAQGYAHATFKRYIHD